MSKVLISGGTGIAGRFIAEAFLARGDEVIIASRSKPDADFFSLPVTHVHAPLDPAFDYAPIFVGVDNFVHAAFFHVTGKYRGGEGDDPEAFCRANVDGTMAMMEAAKKAGVARAVFLSSRAVYDGAAPGTVLVEDMASGPTSLYGQVKLQAEQALSDLADENFFPMSLRATGIYGPAHDKNGHKWVDLFAAFERGDDIAPRVASEVHGHDLAAAVILLMDAPRTKITRFGAAPVFNVSDIVLDRADLLAALGGQGKLPDRADASALNVMDCSRLRSLGWTPKGALDLTGLV